MKITPNDTLFFGGVNHLERNENQWIQSALIPLPSVFYGALSSLFLSNNKQVLSSGNKLGENERVIEIGRIFLHDGTNYYLPLPYDCVFNEEKEKFKVLEFSGEFLETEKNYEYYSDIFISYDYLFYKYFKMNRGEKFGLNYLKVDQGHIGYSYKIGIGLGENKNVIDGHLYRIDQIEFNQSNRTEKWSFVVEYNIIQNDDYNEIPIKGYLKLGGENKSCKYEILDVLQETQNNDRKKIEKKGLTVKLVTFSPAIINKDLNITGKNTIGEKSTFKINGIASGKPLVISGYNSYKNRKLSKKYSALPSGSIINLIVNNEEFDTMADLKKILREKIFFMEYNKPLEKESRLRDGFSEFEIDVMGE